MKKKKYIYFIAVSVFIIMLNIFLMFNQKEVLENIDVVIEKNEMVFIVDGEVQTTVPAKGSGDYDITANCTNGTASWDHDNWGIVINTIDEGNIKCDIEFNEKGTLRIASDIAATGVFLNGPLIKNTIESIEFMTKKTVPIDALGSWDVSENQDKSIMAWYFDSNSNGKYEVYIGGNGEVLANSNSSYLFQNLQYLSSISLSNLNTSNVTDMSFMFYYTGFYGEFTLDIGNQFDTSEVINMSYMFYRTGYSSGFALDLGDKFNTSKVTNMRGMFVSTGHNSRVFTLDLGDKFDTSKVTDMSYMFYATGSYSNNFTLNLGDKFDTSKVTDMSYMFHGTGFSNIGYGNSMFTLDLSDKFDTSNVTNMKYMFAYTGYSSLVFTLDLGDKFDTSKVTNMDSMFAYTGYNNTVFTLDLGEKFNTSNVTDMDSMFNSTGYSSTVFTLNLGDKFDTLRVYFMSYMFYSTGYSNPIFTLNLGNKFNTVNVSSMIEMFVDTGSSNLNFILDLRAFDFDFVKQHDEFNQPDYSGSSGLFNGSKTTHTAYVKNAIDKTWVSDKGFNGSIIDCSATTCP